MPLRMGASSLASELGAPSTWSLGAGRGEHRGGVHAGPIAFPSLVKVFAPATLGAAWNVHLCHIGYSGLKIYKSF